MIKLIATDLDGTLFYPKKKIRLLVKKNIRFIKEFVEKGNRVVLVSGRNYHIANRINRKLKTPIDMIACNGSVVYKDKEIIQDSPMNHNDVLKLYEDNLENKDIISWIFMTDKNNMILVPNKMGLFMTICYRIGMILQFRYQGSYKFGKKHFYKMLKNKDQKIYKAMCIFGLGQKGVKKASLALSNMQQQYGEQFEIFQSKESHEFMNKGVNKATCLLNYMEEEKLVINEVAVVGDSGNDVPLFEVFPNSFVMSQAQEEVKMKANIIVDGVYVLKDYI